MIKTYLIKKLILLIAGLWIIKEGRVLIESLLRLLTQKVLHLMASKYPKLSFLKEV